MSTELKATLSVKGQVSLPAEVDVRSLKGRVARPAKPVRLQGMESAIAERQAQLQVGSSNRS